MKIAIDCRYKSGIGRYLEGILENMDFTKNEYFLIGSKEKLDTFNGTFTPVYCDLSPFSAKGLFKFPTKIINRCDVYFTPNFIIPYGIKIPIYSTIHDVIFLDDKSTVNSKIDYLLKRHLLRRCAKKSIKIFTVSNFSKGRILKHLKYKSENIVITYNSVSNTVSNFNETFEKENLLVFVGNVKKNKGLGVLLDAMSLLDDYKLKIIGSKDNYRTSDKTIMEKLDNSNVEFSGFLSDEEMLSNIARAKFLIQPSFYEGFGLPPIEALCIGTKPIISDIEVFKEIFDGFDVEFFKCGDPVDLANKIKTTNYVIENQKDLISSKYSFNRSSKIIIDILENANE